MCDVCVAPEEEGWGWVGVGGIRGQVVIFCDTSHHADVDRNVIKRNPSGHCPDLSDVNMHHNNAQGDRIITV